RKGDRPSGLLDAARGFVRHEVDVAQCKVERTGHRWIASVGAGAVGLASIVLLLLAIAFAFEPIIGDAGGFAIAGFVGLLLASGALLVARKAE
ncbi:MAG: hypothetical protein V2I24_17160, partial [Halieaceae bacterium]|nr:hypothetical protein [Halieaceae bacterium]